MLFMYAALTVTLHIDTLHTDYSTLYSYSTHRYVTLHILRNVEVLVHINLNIKNTLNININIILRYASLYSRSVNAGKSQHQIQHYYNL